MRLITIQSSKSDWLDRLVQEYVEKIGFFQKFELLNLKSAKQSRDDSASKRKAESALIQKALKPDDYVILFDEHGKSFNSIQFAQKIEKMQISGVRKITFVIGGAFGVDDDLKSRAQEKWKLSDLVFNHHIALAVALEQIYRAYTIIHNKPYHNE